MCVVLDTYVKPTLIRFLITNIKHITYYREFNFNVTYIRTSIVQV